MTGPIIVAVDPREPEQARDALVLGVRLAALHGRPLRAVTVCATPEQASATIAALNDVVAATGTVSELAVLCGGSPARLLHELCDREQPAVLVIGAGRPGPDGERRIGGVQQPLLHGSPAAVAIAPDGYVATAGPIHRIGVGFDGTPESRAALTCAAELAADTEAQPEVLTVQAEDGPPDEALAAASRRLDLLVVGSRSYGPLGAVLLGAVTRRLILTAACPMLIVPRHAVAAEEVVLIGGMEADPTT